MKLLQWAAYVDDEIINYVQPPTKAQLDGRTVKVIALQDADTIRAMAVRTSDSVYLLCGQNNMVSGPTSPIKFKVRTRRMPNGKQITIQQIISSDLGALIYDCKEDKVHIQVKQK